MPERKNIRPSHQPEVNQSTKQRLYQSTCKSCSIKNLWNYGICSISLCRLFVIVVGA